MNPSMAHAHESHFGPPSDALNIREFIDSAKELERTKSAPIFVPSHVSVAGFEAMEQLPGEFRDSIAEECCVADIKLSVENILDNPTLYAHITKTHDTNVYLIHEHADTSGRRKRKRPGLLDPANEPSVVTAFQKTLDTIQLKSWQFMLDSALFMRAPKNSDQNVLTSVKKSSPNLSSSGMDSDDSSQTAIISVTVYNRLTWSHNILSRSSQHALLASQTLGDLFEVIQCTSNEIPDEHLVDGELVGYHSSHTTQGSTGCVVCIEDKAYGDGMSGFDYADKLIAHCEKFPASTRELAQKASTSIYETTLASLTVRLNKPYYLLHQGNCEHFLVIDQIRLLHPSDPSPSQFLPAASSTQSMSPTATVFTPYPLTLQITPPLLQLCRACMKVPAVVSIVGDIRLGESPCLLCRVCWRAMGNGDEDVIVVPLPRYELGW